MLGSCFAFDFLPKLLGCTLRGVVLSPRKWELRSPSQVFRRGEVVLGAPGQARVLSLCCCGQLGRQLAAIAGTVMMAAAAAAIERARERAMAFCCHSRGPAAVLELLIQCARFPSVSPPPSPLFSLRRVSSC